MKLDALTARQRELVIAVEALTVDGVVAPSFEELCKAMRVKSKSTIHWLVCRAVERGWLTKVPGLSRTVRLTDEARAELAREALDQCP